MKTSFAFSQGAQPGIQSFGARLMGAASKRDEAFSTGVKNLGAAEYSAAHAEEARAKAAAEQARQAALNDEPGFIGQQTGLGRSLIEAVLRHQKTGSYDIPPVTPNDDEGNPMPVVPMAAPPELTPEARSMVDRARRLRGLAQIGSPSSVDNLAKAGGEIQTQGITDTVQNLISAGDLMQASARNQAARPGNQIKLYDDTGNTGFAMAPATGEFTTGDNPLAQRKLAEMDAKTATEGVRQESLRAGARFSDARARDITPVIAPPATGGASGAIAPGLPAPKRELTESENFAIEKTATNLGISPADLKTVIQYETGGTFSPGQMGGAGGKYMGLIQFGPEEQRQFGVNPNQTFEQQLGSVENFLRTRGLKPGSDLTKLYTTILAGNPDVPVTAADQNGTIAQHIARMTGGAPPTQAPGYTPTPKDLREAAKDERKTAAQLKLEATRGRNRMTAAESAAAERERQRIATEDRKIAEMLPEARQKVTVATNQINDLKTALTELRDLPGLAGITGGVMGRIPSLGDASTKAQEKYNQIMSNVFVTALQNVKASGSSLGAVSNAEGDKLQNTLAALGRTQSKESLQSEINKALKKLDESHGVITTAYRDKYGRLEAAGGPGVVGRPGAKPAPAGVTFLGFE